MKRKIFFISFIIVFTIINSFAQDVKNNSKAIFHVIVYNLNDSIINQGTGFFIDSIGTAISDINIFGNAIKVEIQTINSKKYKVKQITGYDEETGLVKFSINNKNEKLDYLIPEYKKPKEGENVSIIDITENIKVKNITGAIKSVKYFIKYGNAIQISTNKEKINTGVPVFNEDGKVIAIVINNLLNKDNEDNINFGVDINRIKELDNSLKNPFSFDNDKEMKLNFYDYYLKAIALMQQREWEKALVSINKSIELNYENPAAHTRRGEINMTIRNHKESIIDYTNVLRFDQKDDNAFYNIALNYFRMNMFNETFDYCARAIEYNSKNKEAFCLKGETLFELGNLAEAVSEFTKAIKIDPEYGYAYYQRGVCRAFISKKEDACEDLKNALKYNIIEANDMYKQMCGEDKDY
ncbi:MAG: hypothetical protein A2X12_06085 [Bacteroidetes bacterium GWE2_29_8]|nr:MAG: hypothetical protein A2X12_06085 [Bacteroidetes bacterium GWE2_29_8]OFY20065.1 MAG: hypothetical protein A2X02_06780 [Bacteroidetes bacterium GWF2_29_10]